MCFLQPLKALKRIHNQMFFQASQVCFCSLSSKYRSLLFLRFQVCCSSPSLFCCARIVIALILFPARHGEKKLLSSLCALNLRGLAFFQPVSSSEKLTIFPPRNCTIVEKKPWVSINLNTYNMYLAGSLTDGQPRPHHSQPRRYWALCHKCFLLSNIGALPLPMSSQSLHHPLMPKFGSFSKFTPLFRVTKLLL